jgi:hypothetical protein
MDYNRLILYLVTAKKYLSDVKVFGGVYRVGINIFIKSFVVGFAWRHGLMCPQ